MAYRFRAIYVSIGRAEFQVEASLPIWYALSLALGEDTATCLAIPGTVANR